MSHDADVDGGRADPDADRDEGRHSIGVASDRTGVSAATLRAWEDRYGAVRPDRSAGGHRLYTDRELRRLRILKRLTDHGHRIGGIADRPTPELAGMLEDERAPEPDGSRDAAGSARDVVEELRGAVERYDPDRLEAGLRRAALHLPVGRLVGDVVVPLMRGVGEAWRDGDLSPAQEHLVSGVVARTLGWVMDGLAAPEGAPSVVVAVPEGQRHELGAMLAAATAASAGWRVVYLGGDLPGEDVARAAAETGATAVALSLVHPEGEPSTARALRRLRQGLPGRVTLIVGGRAADSYAPVLRETGAERLDDYDAFRSRLLQLAA